MDRDSILKIILEGVLSKSIFLLRMDVAFFLLTLRAPRIQRDEVATSEKIIPRAQTVETCFQSFFTECDDNNRAFHLVGSTSIVPIIHIRMVVHTIIKNPLNP